jgi:hypothetical protein
MSETWNILVISLLIISFSVMFAVLWELGKVQRRLSSLNRRLVRYQKTHSSRKIKIHKSKEEIKDTLEIQEPSNPNPLVTKQIKEEVDDLNDLVSLVRNSDSDQSNNLFSALAPQQLELAGTGEMVFSMANLVKGFMENNPNIKPENKDSILSLINSVTKVTSGIVDGSENEKLDQLLTSTLNEFSKQPELISSEKDQVD